eukprot:gnl/MRDRNA2_/MRDRNA2_122759_c0_seq1.p1 gnl/MRDRNA2_/MRDRNA2_122759_c0~~gnl/MRDRNA2_/MRDRNA2_122759_c0_seq1.p1  ORF type:complete len:251 (+),score=41.92 gnl/MRDRNA2_/MRDRNA2_122759_c0_seq1:90-842(+)
MQPGGASPSSSKAAADVYRNAASRIAAKWALALQEATRKLQPQHHLIYRKQPVDANVYLRFLETPVMHPEMQSAVISLLPPEGDPLRVNVCAILGRKPPVSRSHEPLYGPGQRLGSWFSYSEQADPDPYAEIKRHKDKKRQDCLKHISNRLQVAATERARDQLIRELCAAAKARSAALDIEFLKADVDGKGAVPWEIAHQIACGVGISENTASHLLNEALPGGAEMPYMAWLVKFQRELRSQAALAENKI